MSDLQENISSLKMQHSEHQKHIPQKKEKWINLTVSTLKMQYSLKL